MGFLAAPLNIGKMRNDFRKLVCILLIVCLIECGLRNRPYLHEDWWPSKTNNKQYVKKQTTTIFQVKFRGQTCSATGAPSGPLTRAITGLFHLSAACSHLPWNSRLFPPYVAMFCQATLARSASSKFHYGKAEGTVCCSLRPSAWHVTVCSTRDAGGRIA